MQPPPTICSFATKGFAALGTPVFRLTEGDKVAAMAVQLNGSEALVTLRSLATVLGAGPDSHDGQMLHLLEQSLRFVSCIRLGDALPTEVLTGEASWQPSSFHKQIASAKLQLQLVNWIGGGADGKEITSQMLVVSVDDPSIRTRVQDALRHAAAELGIEGGGPAVAARIEALATDLAYIEALREKLLIRAEAMVRKLNRLACDAPSLASGRRETLGQVVRLAAIGLAALNERFEQVDKHSADIMPALRDLEQQRDALRLSRDWLYCTQVAWEPHLHDWQSAPLTTVNERVWKLLDALYRFLAPRYMAVQEWQSAMAAHGICNSDRSKVLVW